MKTQAAIGAVIALLAAGAVVWVLMPRGPRVVAVEGEGGEPARSVVVLGAEDGAREVIQVIEPRDGARVSQSRTEDVFFRWHAVPGATRYMFVANDEVGKIVWRGATVDTVFQMPDKAWRILVPGERLKWIVQAPGVGASSDIQRVRIGS